MARSDPWSLAKAIRKVEFKPYGFVDVLAFSRITAE
jgi:hypothetical protein